MPELMGIIGILVASALFFVGFLIHQPLVVGLGLFLLPVLMILTTVSTNREWHRAARDRARGR